MLVHLGHSKLFYQKFFNLLQLLNFFVNFVYFMISLIDKLFVVLSLLVFDHPFGFHFHGYELSFAAVNLITLLSFSVIVIFFFSYSALEKLLFLGDHDSLHPHGSLLELELRMSYFLVVELLH